MKHIDDTTLAERAHAHTPINTQLKVLIACEESQRECKAFRDLGHEAYSCDIQPCRRNGYPQWHIWGDVTSLLRGRKTFQTMDGNLHKVSEWDLIICHPPCTYLCKVSSVHLIRKTESGIIINEERWKKMIDAAQFFRTCLNAKAHYVAVENPLPMKRANLPKPSFFIQPSWYGVKYTKKTLFWVKNLPPLLPEIEFPNPKEFVRASRGKWRSTTFREVAEAMARQWSEYIINDKHPGQ